MDAAATLPNLYLITLGAAMGATIAALAIGVVLVSRNRFLDWAHSSALRRIMRDSTRKAAVYPFKRR